MQADLPHTLYLGKDDRKNKKGDFSYNENDPAIQKQMEANKKAALRRAKQSGEYTIEQLFE